MILCEMTAVSVSCKTLTLLVSLKAREANVVVEDRAFAGRLRQRLVHAAQQEGRRMDAAVYENRSRATRAKEWVALVLMRLALVFQGKKYL